MTSKDISEFAKRMDSKDGHDSQCRLCHAEYMKVYGQNNKEKYKEYCEKNREYMNAHRREYNAKNKEHTKEIRKKRYDNADPDKIKMDQKNNYEKHKKDRLEKAKIYYQKNKEEIIKKVQNYFKKNKDKVMNYHRDYFKNRYKTDIEFKLAECLRKRILLALKKGYKSDLSVALLGCSIEEATIHIENQFVDGMNWEKFLNGEIHLDHIRPLITYDLTDEKQQKQAFNWQNIAPLWALDNLKKGHKWDGIINKNIDIDVSNIKKIYVARLMKLLEVIKEE